MRSPIVLIPTAVLVVGLLVCTACPIFGADTAGSAPALSELRILKNVAVRQKQVYLADICDPDTLPTEWRAIAANLNIGEAPSAGSEKFIDPGQLKAYLAKLLNSQGVGPAEVKLDIPDRIVVRREAVQITQEQVEDIFKKFISDNSPWKQQEVVIQRVHFSGLPLVPVGQMSWEVVPSSPKERYIGNVTANIEFYVNGEKVRTLGVAGRVEVFNNVYLASRPLRQNDIIAPADLELKRVNITDSADRFATRPDQVENRRVLRNIGVHQPIELQNLDKPLVLKRGDPVTIVYDQPGIQVTAKGQASADGGVGDSLSVVNVSSKKTIVCRVVDSQTVQAAR
jgi:flagellar basal body P-ring formation protein FlgA